MGWTQYRYMPRLTGYTGRLSEIPFDFDELLAALAPRTVLVSAPIGDTNFQWRSVQKVGLSATAVFKLLDAENCLNILHPGCGHDFPDDVRERAYRVLQASLGE